MIRTLRPLTIEELVAERVKLRRDAAATPTCLLRETSIRLMTTGKSARKIKRMFGPSQAFLLQSVTAMNGTVTTHITDQVLAPEGTRSAFQKTKLALEAESFPAHTPARSPWPPRATLEGTIATDSCPSVPKSDQELHLSLKQI